MPVARVCFRERERYALFGQAGLDSRSIIDVQVVIEIDKLIADCLTENDQGDSNQEQIYGNSYGTIVNPFRSCDLLAAR